MRLTIVVLAVAICSATQTNDSDAKTECSYDSNIGMAACARDEFEAADRELNEAYVKLEDR